MKKPCIYALIVIAFCHLGSRGYAQTNGPGNWAYVVDGKRPVGCKSRGQII